MGKNRRKAQIGLLLAITVLLGCLAVLFSQDVTATIPTHSDSTAGTTAVGNAIPASSDAPKF